MNRRTMLCWFASLSVRGTCPAKGPSIVFLLLLPLLAVSLPLRAATYLWDSNTGVTGVQDGGGTWSAGGTTWWNPATGTDVAITSTDIASFGASGVGGTVTLSGNQTVDGLIFGQSLTTGYTLAAGSPTTLTLGASGILVRNGAQAVTISQGNLSLALSAAQTWTNRSTNALTIGGAIDNGGNLLTLASPAGLAGTGSFNLNGAITGAGGLALSTPGTVALTGAASYTGATTLVNGSTLSLSGPAGVLSGTSGITLSSGILTMINAVGESAVNRVADTIAIASNGGTINWTNPSGDTTANWAETLGVLTLNKGQTNIITTNAVASGKTQALTLGAGSLTHASGNTATIAFGGPSLGVSTNVNNIFVTSQATTASGQIIGPWALYGSSAAALTDYASYNRNAGTTNTRGIQAAGIANSAETTWTTAANSYSFNAAVTLTGTRTIAAVRDFGAALTLSLGTSNFNLATYGVLNGGTGALTISNGTGGTGGLTTPTGGDNTLFVIGGNNTITVSAPIIDNGTAVNVVKAGSQNVTFSGTNTYSGVTTINSGTLIVSTIANGGGASTLGQSSNAASNLVLNGGALSYSAAASTAGSTDRLFTVGEAGGTITTPGSNNNALTFSNTGSLVMSGTGDRTLNLTTTGGTGTFTFNPVIVDPTGGGKTSLNVSAGSTGVIVLAPSANNTFTGGITIQNRTLQVRDANGLGGNVVYFGSGTTPTLELRANAATNFGANGSSLVFGTNSGTILLSAVSASNGVTHTIGPVSIGTATLTLSRGSNMNTNNSSGLTTTGLTLTGDPTINLNSGSGTAAPLVTFGALDDGGVARTITVTGGAGGTGKQYIRFATAASTFSAGTNLIYNGGVNGGIRLDVGNGFGTSSNFGLITFAAPATTGGVRLLNNTSTTFFDNFSLGNNDVLFELGRTSAAATSVTHTVGTLSIGNSTLTVTGAINETSPAVASLVFGATTFTGNSTLNLANVNTGVGTVTLGALNDGGVARSITKSGLATLQLNTAATSMISGTTITAIGGTSAANSLVRIGNNNALGSSTLVLGDGVNGAGQVSINSGINVASTSAITYAGGYVTVGGAPISGPTSGTGTISGTININSNDTSISTSGWGHIMGGGGTLVIAGPIVTGGTNTANEVDIFSGNVTLSNSAGNTYTSLRINQGTTTLGVNNAIPTGANVALAELGATTLSLGSFNQTIASGATWTLGGTGPTLENNVGTLATGTGTLTVNGTIANNTGSLATQLVTGSVSFGGTSGTFNIDSGHATSDMTVSASLSNGSLIKTGAGILTLSGTKTLTGLTINDGTVVGGYGASGVQTITISSTGSLQLVNNLAETLTLAGSTGSLNVAGGARIGLELGAPGTSDLLTVGAGGTAATSGTVTLDFYNLGALGVGTYNLLTAPSGLTTGGTTYNVGNAPLGFNYTINATDTLVQLITTAITARYWTGSQATGSWSTINAGPLSNWSSDAAGATNATDIPNSAHTVIFSATNATGPAISTTLDGAFTIDALQFLAAPTGVTAVNIAAGTGGTLTVAPASSSAGIYVATNAGAVTLASGLPYTVGATQTWNVVGGGANGSSLVMAANVNFNGNAATKGGAGALTLSGTNTGTGTLTLSAGTLNLNSATALGGTAFIVNGGTTLDNSSAGAISLSTANAITINGNFVFTGTKDLNLGTGTYTLASNAGITTNASTLTLGGVVGESGGARAVTKLGAGALTLGGNNTFSGGVNLNAGTLNVNNAGALGTGTFTISSGTTIDNSSGAAITNSKNNAQVWNGNFTFTGSNDLNLGTGAVDLGSSSGTSRTVTVSAGTLTIGGDISNGAVGTGIVKAGSGTLVLSGNSDHTGTTDVNSGVLTLTGSLTGNGTTAGGTTLRVAPVAGTAVLNIAGDITDYHSFNFAGVSGANAVVNQTGGTVNFTTTSTSDTFNLVSGSASGSYGYLNITGGTMNTLGRMQISRGSGAGVAYIGGTGTLNAKGEWMMIAYGNSGAIGSLTIGPGGTLDRSGASNVLGIFMNQANQYGVLNLAGGDYISTNRVLQLGNGAGGTNNIGLVNFAAGTITTGVGFGQNVSTSTGQQAFINLAGATLRATANITNFFPNTVTGQTVVTTLYGGIDNTGTAQDFTGGFTVDTNGFTVSMSNPIVPPSASGVTRSGLTITGGSGYVGAPMVQFLGGTLAAGGSPAAGYAVISNGQVVDIVITSPGSYTVAPTVTLTGGGGTGAGVSVDTLITNATNAGLTKNGASTLTLSNATSTFTGPVVINGGTLSVSGTAALANIGTASAIGTGDATSTATNAASIVLNGGTFSMTSLNAPATTDRLFTVTANGGTIDQANGTAANIVTFTNTNPIVYTGSGARTLTLSGVNTGTSVFNPQISDAGADQVTLNKTGAGTWLVANASNSYTGGTNISAGVLAFDAGALGTAGNITFTGNSTLRWDTGTTTDLSSRLVLNDGVTGTIDTGSNNVTFANAVGTSGGTTGVLRKDGAGALTLNAAAVHTGGTTLNAGTLNIGNAAALGTGTFTISGTSTIDNSSGSAMTLAGNPAQAWNANFTFTGTNDLNMGTGAVTLSAARTVTVSTGTLTVGGVIDDGAGNFAFTKAGAGTLYLKGTNTFGSDSAFTIQGGTVIADSAAAFGASTNNILFSTGAGALRFTNSASFDATQQYFRITNVAATMNVDAGATVVIANGATGSTTTGINSASTAGTGSSLIKTGLGTLQISGSQSNFDADGGWVINQGTLSLAGNNTAVLGDATAGVAVHLNGGALSYDTDTPNIVGFANIGTFLEGNSSVVNNLATAGSGITQTLNALTVQGNFTMNVQGGANVTSGTATVVASSATLNGSPTFNITDPVTGGTTLFTVGAITGNANGITLTGNGDFAQTGAYASTAATALTLGSTYSGTATLSQTNTYTGVTAINGGTLEFASSANLGNASATNDISLGGGTLRFTPATTTLDLTANRQVNLVTGTTSTIDVAASTSTLQVTGGIAATGSANLVKAGLGTLAVTGPLNLNGGNVSVNGGTLQAGLAATGIGGVAVANGATLNLYDGSTITSAISGLTLASGSALGFDLNAPGVNDVLNLTGTPSISPTVSLNFNNLGGLAVGTYDLINITSGTLNAANYALGLAPSGFNYSFTTVNGDQTLRLTASTLSLRYWQGDVDSSWSTNSAGNTNWATNVGGTTDLGALPVATDTLVFSTTNATGPTITTTLDGNFTADSLQFTANPTGVTSVTINQGTSGTLTLSPISANNGISVATGAGNVTIGAPVVAGANQTWEVVDSGSLLTVGGNVTFTGSVTKTGAGSLTLSGNNGGAGGVDLVAGTLNLGSATALGTGNFTIEAGTTFTNSTASALTLSPNNTQTWNGGFTFGGTKDLNMGTGAVTLGNSLTATVSNTLSVGGAIDDGASTFALTKAGAGTLVLNGNNGYDGVTTLGAGTLTLAGNNSGAAGGVTMAAATTLNINNANALGSGTFEIDGGIIDNTSGAAITNAGNNAQSWNGSFTFTGSNDLNLGTGTVALGTTSTVTVAAGTLTVGGVIDGGFGLAKAGTGTLNLTGLSTSSANNYSGTTTLDGGTTIITTNASLAGGLTVGASNTSTNASTLDLTNGSATFAGPMLVQTNTATANTITIGSGHTLTNTGSVTIGVAGSGTADMLTVSGAGAWNVNGSGLTFRVGGSSTVGSTNTLNMTNLGTFTANLGTAGTFVVGSTDSGAPSPGDTNQVNLAPTSTITAGTFSVGGSASHASSNTVSMGSGVTSINANTVSIGQASTGRSNGILNFAGSGGSVVINAADGSSPAVINVVNASGATNTSSMDGSLLLAGHLATVNGSTVTVGSRTATGTWTTATSTGTITFDQGTFNATSLVLSKRAGSSVTTGTTTGNATFGGGNVSLGAVTMSQNSASTSNSTGNAIATLTFNGNGTNSITTLNMGSSTLSGTTATGGTQATLNQSGTANTTIGAINMASNASTAAVSTATTSTSAINLSGGTIHVTGDISMATTSANTNNSSTGSISITGGTLIVDGNIAYTNGVGTETNSITLNGGTLDMTNGSIGSSGSPITLNAQSGTLQNLATLNSGGTLTKTTAGTLILEGTNTYLGTTLISAGILQVGSGSTTGTLGSGDVTNNGTLTFNRSNTYTVANNITGTGNLVQAGAGTTVLTGANSYGGPTTISAGTLQLGNGGTAGTLGSDAGPITDNGMLAVNRSDTVTIANVITGTGGLTQQGTGTTVVTGTNTYSGPTSVTSGTLQVGVAGTGSTGSSSVVTVNGSGAALAGSGTVNGNTSVLVGTVRPGDTGGSGVGTLTVSGNLSVSTGGTLEFKVVAADSPADTDLVSYLNNNPSSTTKDYLDSLGSLPASYTNHNGQNDFLSIGGSLTMASSGTVTLVNGITNQAQGDIFHLIDWATLTSKNNASLFTGTFSSISSDFVLPTLNAGLAWDVSAFKTYGIVSIVPEPTRAVLLLAGLVLSIMRRRRR